MQHRQVPVIEFLALFSLVAFIFWQTQPALNTETRQRWPALDTETRWLTPPAANWPVERRAEELHKLQNPLPLWKELFKSKENWYQTIRKRVFGNGYSETRRREQEAAEFLAVQANQ